MIINKLKVKIQVLSLLFILSMPNLSIQAQTQYYKYVDPFIGTEGAGNVVVGPTCPYGMVKPGPDCSRFANAGYRPDLKTPVYGFSQVHVSGTGGGAKYGNISVMPFLGGLDSIKQTSLRKDETAALGYYSVILNKSNIKIELTASHKVAFYRFNFNAPGNRAVKLDAGEFLNEGGNIAARETQHFVGSQIKVLSATEVCGYNRVRGGWNSGRAYTVYFHAVFDKPMKNFKTWKGDKLFEGQKDQIESAEKTGALLSFGDAGSILQMKIGISFVSEDRAKINVATETPNWSFEEILNQTQQKWEKLLSRIEIDKNASDSYKRMFYTGMYHSMLMPVDRGDENPLWKSKNSNYDDFYAIWDTYRSSHPLITLIDPKRQVDIVNGLLDIYQFDKFLPDARSGNSNGRTQGGSNAEILIADAYAKGLKGIDYKLALKAMLNDADVAPGGNEEQEGRGGLLDYNKLGYVSTDFVRAGTRTVEYSYNDFAIALVANGLGENAIFQRFKKQANNWKNLWRNYTSDGATGFIWPKDAKGNWVDAIKCTAAKMLDTTIAFSPRYVNVGQCEDWWSGFLYEGNSWEYSLSIPHDIAGLIKLSGGDEAFKKRLDAFFDKKIYYVGNEPAFLTPLMYHWIGKPELSSDRVLTIIKAKYNDSRKGIPGNDDSGAMSSWLAFHMIGIYPNAGQSYYLIHTPMLAETVIHLENGNSFKIVAKNLSATNKYITSAKLNNKPYPKSWIEHVDIEAGGVLELEMSDKPLNWGNSNLPPSLRFN